jgi:hypothetical protein
LIIPCGDDLFPIVHIPKIGGLPGRGRPYFNSGRGDAPNVAPKLEVPVNPSLVGTYFFCDTAANTAAASTNRGAWRHSPRSFVLRQSAHSHSPSGLILEIHVGEGLSIPVADAEAFGGFIDLPRWCEGAASGHGRVKNIAGTKSTAPAIDFAFTLNNRDGNLALSFPRRRRKGRVGAQTFSGWHLYCEGRERRARRALGRCHDTGKCNSCGRTETGVRLDFNSRGGSPGQQSALGTQDATQHSSETLTVATARKSRFTRPSIVRRAYAASSADLILR